MFRALAFLLVGSSLLFSESIQITIANGIPEWMETQIERDLSFFKDKPISLEELSQVYRKRGERLQAVKFTIQDNQVILDNDFIHDKMHMDRIVRYVKALTKLCKTVGMPNMTFLLSVNDGLNAREGVPIFAMCKTDSDQILLLPDYEILDSRYQVLCRGDIMKADFPWESKNDKLMWRGSTAQLWRRLTETDVPFLSRVKLCELSLQHPDLIDAKFTIFAQGGENIPSLRKFKGERVSFEDQLKYKYAIVIDGNTFAYSASGWKLFGNFLIFKPDSDWIQWYSSEFMPWEHYIPVRSNLSDLVEMIRWAKANDESAERIAQASRDFALTHLAIEDDLAYLYFACLKYSKLRFIP